MEEKQKNLGFGLIGLIIVVAIIGLLAGGGLYFKETQNKKSQIQIGLELEKKARELKEKIENRRVETACIQDVKQCSDGSYVNRVGPDCEFAKCPGENVSRGTVEGRVISLSDVIGIPDLPIKGYLVFVVAFENLQKFIGQSKITLDLSGDITFSIDNEEALLNYVVASTTTAESGFYYFDLKPAHYALCLADNKFVLGCYDVTLAKKQKSKVDMSWGLGGLGSNAKSIKSFDVVSEQSEQIDISTWKTYRNEKYGFEVKYPTNFEIRMYEGYKSAEFKACAGENCIKFLVLDWGPIELGGSSPYKNYHRLEKEGYLDNAFYFYSIDVENKAVDGIISTFKFIE